MVISADEEGDEGDEDQGDHGVANCHPLLMVVSALFGRSVFAT
jgi:hypothetical protein